MFLLVFGDAYVTRAILGFVERHRGAAHVGTMPHGIDEALLPRFLSQEGREIVPVVMSEGARELALRTPIPRVLSFGRKTNDFLTKR